MDGFHHIALRVSDCERSARFYQGAFGMREVRRVPDGDGVRALWLRRGEAVLMLERTLRGRGPDHGSGHVLVFSAPDLALAEETLRAANVEITDRTPSTLYVEDPDGHRAGVSVFPFEGGPS